MSLYNPTQYQFSPIQKLWMHTTSYSSTFSSVKRRSHPPRLKSHQCRVSRGQETIRYYTVCSTLSFSLLCFSVLLVLLNSPLYSMASKLSNTHRSVTSENQFANKSRKEYFLTNTINPFLSTKFDLRSSGSSTNKKSYTTDHSQSRNLASMTFINTSLSNFSSTEEYYFGKTFMVPTKLKTIVTRSAKTHCTDSKNSSDLTANLIVEICSKQTTCSRIIHLFKSNPYLGFCSRFPVLPLIYNVNNYSNESMPAKDLHKCLKDIFSDLDITCFQPKLLFELSMRSLSSLQLYFSSEKTCSDTLNSLVSDDESAKEIVASFGKIMNRSPCHGNTSRLHDPLWDDKLPNPGIAFCDECMSAYLNWTCSIHFNYYEFMPELQNNNSAVTLAEESPIYEQLDADTTIDVVWPILIKPCSSWCLKVEQLCPYLNPTNETWNGGEPAFLCDESHYHQSSRYRPPEKENCGLGANQDEWRCCYAEFHLVSQNETKCPDIRQVCQREYSADVSSSNRFVNDDNIPQYNESYQRTNQSLPNSCGAVAPLLLGGICQTHILLVVLSLLMTDYLTCFAQSSFSAYVFSILYLCDSHTRLKYC